MICHHPIDLLQLHGTLLKTLVLCQTPPTHRGTRGGKNSHRMVENQISTTDYKPKCSPQNCTLLVWKGDVLLLKGP